MNLPAGAFFSRFRWIEYNVQYLCDLIDPDSGNFYTFEQTRNKLNTNNLKENCVNVNFDILSKTDAYLERIVHSKNVRFVYKTHIFKIFNLNCYTGSFLPIPFYIK